MEKKYLAFCVRCKKKVEVSDPVVIETKGSRGSRKMAKGKCSECGTKVCAILKNDGTQNQQ